MKLHAACHRQQLPQYLSLNIADNHRTNVQYFRCNRILVLLPATTQNSNIVRLLLRLLSIDTTSHHSVVDSKQSKCC